MSTKITCLCLVSAFVSLLRPKTYQRSNVVLVRTYWRTKICGKNSIARANRTAWNHSSNGQLHPPIHLPIIFVLEHFSVPPWTRDNLLKQQTETQDLSAHKFLTAHARFVAVGGSLACETVKTHTTATVSHQTSVTPTFTTCDGVKHRCSSSAQFVPSVYSY